MRKPSFIITVDTEPDDLWRGDGSVTCRNADFLPRFQALCERYSFKPVYLTDYDMSRDPTFVAFAKDAVKRETAEIGMHLHAWLTPPFDAIDEAKGLKRYLVEYDDALMAAKIDTVTQSIRDNFGVSPVSHRAGRWAFDHRYLWTLEVCGYLVDCSVTPGVSVKKSSPESAYVPVGYEGFPEAPYFMSREDVRLPGTSGMLQVPMTIRRDGGQVAKLLSRFAPRVARRLFPTEWLRPTGNNLGAMRALVRDSVKKGEHYLEFMIHSSELMPGGSPYFPDEGSIERLYADLDVLFAEISETHEGQTLAGFRERYVADR